MEIIGYIAALFSLIGFLPQTIKTIKTRRTEDLSLSTFVLVIVSTSLWCIYGITLNNPAIWFTNGFNAFCSILIVIIKIQNQTLKSKKL